MILRERTDEEGQKRIQETREAEKKSETSYHNYIDEHINNVQLVWEEFKDKMMAEDKTIPVTNRCT